MGAVCSAGIADEDVKSGERERVSRFSGKLRSIKSIGAGKKNHNLSFTEEIDSRRTPHKYDSGELKPPTPARDATGTMSQRNSFIGRAGTVGLEKAVGVLDTLGSSMTNLNNSGFLTGGSRGNRIAILSFEVANTIAKGAKMLQSLSEENIQFLKGEVMQSEGVQNLVSKDKKELLRIAAADKREELDLFSREVIRFGDQCKDPQWHNLGRYFSRLDSDDSSHPMLRSEAEMTMQELTTIAQHTSELYHELSAEDRFEQDYRRKIEEARALQLPLRGESLTMLQSELKQQRKLVRNLKKKSLWAKNLDEIVEKLVDIVTYTHQAISEAFGDNGVTLVRKEQSKNPQRLGVAGLALHYANMITQIDTIASRPTSLPPNTRDNLYHGLPDSVKKALRSRLQTLDAKEELLVSQVKAEMEKTLRWLVPVAANTNKAHQGFGWVGEWANAGIEFGQNTPPEDTLIRLQTLYHADKQKTDLYILELVTWLHHLINIVRHSDHGLKPFPIRSPTRKGVDLHSKMQRVPSMDYSTNKSRRIQLSEEDRNLLDDVLGRMKRAPGISKSQEFAMSKKKGTRAWALSRSTGSSTPRELNPWGRLDHPRTNSLDIIDGLG